MKRFLIALSLLAIAGCSSGEDDSSATPTPAADGDAPATTSRRPMPPPSAPMGAPQMGMGGPGGTGGGQSAVAMPPMAAANKATELPSKTGSLNPAPPVKFDTDKFIDQGAPPKTVKSAKPGTVVATPGPSTGAAGMSAMPSQMRPPGGSAPGSFGH